MVGGAQYPDSITVNLPTGWWDEIERASDGSHYLGSQARADWRAAIGRTLHGYELAKVEADLAEVEERLKESYAQLLLDRILECLIRKRVRATYGRSVKSSECIR